MAVHAVLEEAPGEKSFIDHPYKKRRDADEGLNLLKTKEDQKQYIEQNAKELARLFVELEKDIKKLPDMDKSEEYLLRELEYAEKDNSESIKKLERVKEMSGNLLKYSRES